MIGKDLTNPIPEWAEHDADRKAVPYTVATEMDSPTPDTGEEFPHTNTQLFNILSEQNRFKLGAEISVPYNAPQPGQAPTMDGFVTDYISTLTSRSIFSRRNPASSPPPRAREGRQQHHGPAPDR